MTDSPELAVPSRDEMTALLAELEALYTLHGISDEEKMAIYTVLSSFCRYQIENQVGDFYQQVKHLLKSE
jgi:hypothetical protein